MKTCGIIILAAGNSSRLGRAKQLLTFNNKSLLKHVLDEAQAIEEAHVILVLGAEQETLQNKIEGSSAVVCYNPRWQEGMASSIHLGVQKLLELQPDVSCCLISVCDQPYVSTEIFQGLIDCFKNSGSEMVACSYADTAGTPALFGKSHFPDLLRLNGQEGAKRLLKTFESQLTLIPFLKGEIDIDTETDYQNLLSDS